MSCLNGYTLLNNYPMCGSECPLNTVVYQLDERYCVSTECPPSTTKDGTDQSICWKQAITKVGQTCASGFTEWTPGFCYADCPNGYRENGRNCVLSLLPRLLKPPSCGSFYYFDDASQQCVLSSWLLVFITILIFLGLALHYFFIVRATENKPSLK